MHNDKDLVRKYMKSICIGAVQKDRRPVKEKDKVALNCIILLNKTLTSRCTFHAKFPGYFATRFK